MYLYFTRKGVMGDIPHFIIFHNIKEMAELITQNDETETLEAPAPPKKKILKGNLPVPPPVKKERTPAQIAAFERARASRDANLKKREADAKRLAEYDSMMVKQKLVEKAKKIKLKTMKKIETIEAISSDDDSEEEAPPIQKPKTKPSGNAVSRPLPAESKPPQPAAAAPVRPKPVLPFKFVRG